MEWKDNKKENIRRNSDTNKYMFFKIARQVYKEKEIIRLSTSKFLKDYLDEKELGFFKFGVDKKGSKVRLFVLFSDEEDTFYALRNAEKKHKVNVSINQIVEDLKEDGIELPFERLKLGEVTEAEKEKLGVYKKSHLFEVQLPTTTSKG